MVVNSRETCLNVRSIASSFSWSRCSISASIDFCDVSSSFRRFRSWSRCVVKLLYWSNAFLLMCLYFLSASLTLRSLDSICCC